MPPLVLVHGLWDTPRLFRHLLVALDGRRGEPLVPHLPHRLGATPLQDLAQQLAASIQQVYGHGVVDVLGFSMGGLVARAWLQDWGGHRRCRRFTVVGSPQEGTLTAQLIPRSLLAGIADMKIGSDFLRRLQAGQALLDGVECRSFYCRTDLMVLPGWRAVLPRGHHQALPVWTHAQLIHHPRALVPLVQALCS